MIADSPAHHHSPPVNLSPEYQKGSSRNTLSSPWAKIVRGEPETMSITPSASPPLPSISESEQEFSDLKDQSISCLGNSANQLDSCNGNVGVSQKPAWKPLAEADSVPVIDGPCWPALAKHTPPLRNKSSSKSSKSSFDGSSVPAPNSQKKAATANPFIRQGQRSIKQGAESGTGGETAALGASAQNAVESESDQPPPLPHPSHRLNNGQRVSRESSNSYKGNHNLESRPMGGGGGGSHRTNTSSRRGNAGPRPRGGALNGIGVYNHNHRHDHRNNWTASRGSNVHLRPTMGPPPPPPPPPYRGFLRPPPTPLLGSSPFIPMRPIRNPMGLDMAPSPFLYGPPLGGESYWAMPLDSHPSPPPPHPPIFLPPLMPLPLATSLLNQIDFYFSEANLLTDEYLKKNMDAEGWVPISLIANFRRVQRMTNNIELILTSLRVSNVVEVEGDKVRRRNDWMRWVRFSSSDQPISTSSLTLENGTKVNANAAAAAALDESLKEEEAIIENAS